MTTFKILIAAALVSMAAVNSTSAQVPTWAASDPAAYQAQYPNGDALNGGALGLQGAPAPVYRAYDAYNAYAATGRAHRTRLYRSYDRATGAFPRYEGRGGVVDPRFPPVLEDQTPSYDDPSRLGGG
jgi:hypothetical protein